MKDIVIIIPSLDPSNTMLKLIADLKALDFHEILVVNDGSHSKYDSFYQKAQEEYGCKLLKNYTNMGKGRALKNAFHEILLHYPDAMGAVTVDSDGQHLPTDIEKCAKALKEQPTKLIMGCRNFKVSHENPVPFRSRFGNLATCFALKVLCGIQLSDTQTGLRGLSKKTMTEFLTVEGERFEYETNMILQCKDAGIEMLEVPIETVYLEGNESSHFNPLRDSFKIYSLLLKFSFASFASFLLDIFLFTILVARMKGTVASYILISSVLARMISMVFNFTINKNKIFKSSNKMGGEAFRYFLLAIVQLGVSATLTESAFQVLQINESVVKMIVDGFLFLISFQIQAKWVFRK